MTFDPSNIVLDHDGTKLEHWYRLLDNTIALKRGNPWITLVELDATLPGSLPAGRGLDGSHPVLEFRDASPGESAYFTRVLPDSYNGGGLTVDLVWGADTATSGNVKWSVAFERHDSAHDLDSDAFATAQTITTPTSTNGAGWIVQSSIVFADGSEMDSLAAGEPFRIKILRDTADAADTMSGDVHLVRTMIRETTP